METCSAVSGSSWLHDLTLVVFTVAFTFLCIAAHNHQVDKQAEEAELKSAGDAAADFAGADGGNKRPGLAPPRRQLARTSGDGAGMMKISGSKGASLSSSLAASLTYIDGVEASGNFLSAIFSQMWSQMNVSVSNAIKDALDPTLRDLPVALHFVRVDLGDVPIKTSNMFIHRKDLEQLSGEDETTTEKQAGIQIDVDVTWDGNCDITLQATMTKSAKFTLGVKHVKLSGRMFILLSPLTAELPVVTAVQYGFLNPPDIRLDFVGVAQALAKRLPVIRSSVTKVVDASLRSLLVLPQRMVMPLDLGGYDYLDTYNPPVGMIRVTAVRGRGFNVLKKSVLRDIPDVYCLISLGASDKSKTTTRNNDMSPSWADEPCDFILYDMDQKIYLEAMDDETGPNPDEELGEAAISVRELFRAGGTAELSLEDKDAKEETGRRVTVSASLFYLSRELGSLSSPSYDGKNKLCGLVTIIVTKAFDVGIPKDDAATFVKVTYGEGAKHEKEFFTGTVVDYPGIDALNPMFDCVFHVPLTVAMLKAGNTTGANNIIFELIDNEGPNNTKPHGKLGSTTVKHEELAMAFNQTITETRLLTPDPSGPKLEFRVILRGVKSEEEKFRSITSQEAKKNLSSSIIQPKSIYGGMEQRLTIRVTAVRGRGFDIKRRRLGKKDDVPDVYCNILLTSSHVKEESFRPQLSSVWKTATIKDDTMPRWNETRDYNNVTPSQETLTVDVYDQEKGVDELLGSALFPVEKLLRKRMMEVELLDGSTPTGSYVTLRGIQVIAKPE